MVVQVESAMGGMLSLGGQSLSRGGHTQLEGAYSARGGILS